MVMSGTRLYEFAIGSHNEGRTRRDATTMNALKNHAAPYTLIITTNAIPNNPYTTRFLHSSTIAPSLPDPPLLSFPQQVRTPYEKSTGLSNTNGKNGTAAIPNPTGPQVRMVLFLASLSAFPEYFTILCIVKAGNPILATP